MLSPILLCALVCLAQQPAQTPAQTPPEPKPVDVHAEHPARPLFLANCAQCHGETGDGQGTTKLDRQARSFQDGGFSYGNTPEALVRTITYGIPGSPMPSFEKALALEQRKQLAEYVLLLGPVQEKTDAKDSVMVVKDRPLVVRGKLPPVVEGGPEFPRGLLIGTPEGLSFEYRTDDVRLLAVRNGEFADRADWRGRGGDALVPLGKTVHVRESGSDDWIFARFGALSRRQMRASEVLGGAGRLRYELLDPSGKHVANVLETPTAFTCSAGAGYARRFEIDPGVPDPQSALASHEVHGALAELKLRRGLASPRANVLVLEEITLPGVLWPADAAGQKKLMDSFLAEAKR
ncbi:MAG: c-type cytochrome [Planctomycetes bacterium]|nr:c-type cytochrome [Planctomycetota bacterium]